VIVTLLWSITGTGLYAPIYRAKLNTIYKLTGDAHGGVMWWWWWWWWGRHLRQETCGRKSRLRIEIGVDIAASELFNLLRLDFCDQCFIHTFCFIFTNVCWLTFCVDVLKVLPSIDSQGLLEVAASDRIAGTVIRHRGLALFQFHMLLEFYLQQQFLFCFQRYLIHETL
jgi:hypothetical protein